MENRRFKIREEVVRRTSEIEGAGARWRLSVHDINDGMTVKLNEAGNKDLHKQFLLDYQFADVSTARLHMMPGATENTDVTEKLSRLALWAKAIETYDSIMTPEAHKELPIEKIQELLERDIIPRIEKVVAPTSNPTLRALLSRFSSFKSDEKNGTSVDWAELVAFAKREKWV